MSTNKRRKLDGSGASTPTAMSAFAARQQLWGTTASAQSNGARPEKGVTETKSRGASPSRTSQTLSATPGRAVPGARNKRHTPEDPVSVQVRPGPGFDSGKSGSGPSTPRLEPTGTTMKQHTSFRPSKKNFHKKAGGKVVLATPQGERLVILGSFGIKVREGEATIAGAVLTPADDIQWVHAPHCHAVPVLRTVDDTVLELKSHPAAKGLRQLGALNPVFARIWDESSEETNTRSKSPSTYQIIYTSNDLPKRATLQELVSPGEWNKKLSGLVAERRKSTLVVFLCGPKSSGKSTFGKLLTNRFVTDRAGSRNKPWWAVMVLDIDPGQPEFSPPGVISLCKITTPNLSPSFCHPTLTREQGQVRAHAIASVTPGLDPDHYIACVLDLFSHYQRSADAGLPLVINTPGWVQGTGLDILTELITSIHPTEVIYMSQDGPEETVRSLRSAASVPTPTTTTPSTTTTTTATHPTQPPPRPPPVFTTLPSQSSEPPSSSRTSLHFRTMQTMSYFHLSHPPPLPPPLQPPSPPAWNPVPLSTLRPWRVRYAGKHRGFRGILCYDHQPAPALLPEAINGTVLAVVRLEDRRAALAGLGNNAEEDESEDEKENKDRNEVTSGASRNPNPKHNPSTNIPLIPNPLGLTLPPQHTHTLGLVLVRGVDTVRHELQLLTPLAAEVIAGFQGTGTGTGASAGAGSHQDIVLVAGRFDTPSWAYSEDLYWRRAGGGGGGGVNAEDGDGDGEDEIEIKDESEGEGEDEGQSEVPWVEMLHGSQKRAVGSKVWRVRRDLGKN
ncbi:hypothetical protein B0J18DRAFT_286139 [Chaetomium sp. MPI-SDFR-AT-0129]|nr:hypothetical protein B0J18DRAFT_286139 [Chaetomium sp. MPI-SDFR-AT-0129]